MLQRSQANSGRALLDSMPTPSSSPSFHQEKAALLLNPEHTFRKLSCLSALFRLFLGPLELCLLDVSSDMYPEPSGSVCRSSKGRAEPVAERMRSTKLCPGATPPEAILHCCSACAGPYQGPCSRRPRCRIAGSLGQLCNCTCSDLGGRCNMQQEKLAKRDRAFMTSSVQQTSVNGMQRGVDCRHITETGECWLIC